MHPELRGIAAWVCAALLLAQLSAAPQRGAGLTVDVVQGQGAIHNIARGSVVDLLVVVKDADRTPVEGATVTFTLPAVGPGGAFADGGRTLMLRTDAQGRAASRNFQPNRVPGQYDIRVTAAHEGRTASASIHQTNADPGEPGKGSGRKWAIVLGVVGGAVAAGAFAAAGGRSSSGAGASTPADVTSGSVTPGTPGFGPPR